jgi:hypothetical protein
MRTTIHPPAEPGAPPAAPPLEDDAEVALVEMGLVPLAPWSWTVMAFTVPLVPAAPEIVTVSPGWSWVMDPVVDRDIDVAGVTAAFTIVPSLSWT